MRSRVGKRRLYYPFNSPFLPPFPFPPLPFSNLPFLPNCLLFLLSFLNRSFLFSFFPLALFLVYSPSLPLPLFFYLILRLFLFPSLSISSVLLNLFPHLRFFPFPLSSLLYFSLSLTSFPSSFLPPHSIILVLPSFKVSLSFFLHLRFYFSSLSLLFTSVSLPFFITFPLLPSLVPLC